jgi:hypothetical protein
VIVMTDPLICEFALSSSESGHGVSCDATGAYIDSISLPEKRYSNGQPCWTARDSDKLSAEMSARYGLPIDFSSRANGLNAVACALNDGDIARAQLVTLFLRFPTSPDASASSLSLDNATTFFRSLQINGLIKVWNPEEHPRWPAGAPDDQGGQFAPKDGDTQVADNRLSGAVGREAAAVGCISGIVATTPEGAAAGCAASGPGCPIGGTVGGAVTAIGSCIAGGVAGYEACHSIGQSNPARPANPDRPTDRAIKDQCIARCSPLLERPERAGKWGTNEWDFRECLDECIKEKKAYWGD